LEKEVDRKEERWRKGQQHTSETGTREPLACRGVRKPGSEGLSARQRDTGKGQETGGAATKGLELTSLCPSSKDSGTTGHAGRGSEKEGEQEEQEEDAAEEEQPVGASEEEEEEEEKEDDDEE